MVNRELQILLVEDNEDDVFLFREACKKADVSARIDVVGDGIEAIGYLNRESVSPIPDLMLLDLNMPRMNGFEVLEAVRRDEKFGNLIIHILTTSSRDADIERAYALRANSYIVKPSQVEEMVLFAGALHEWHRFTVPPLSS